MAVFATGPMQMTYKAAADLPQTGDLSLFTVVGTVRARFFSRVTTVLGASGGSTVKYLFTPAVGASSSDFSTAADLSTAAAGLFVFTHGVTIATRLSTGQGAAASSAGNRPAAGLAVAFWLADGTLKMNASGNQTGQMEHFIHWIPMTPGSYVYSV